MEKLFKEIEETNRRLYKENKCSYKYKTDFKSYLVDILKKNKIKNVRLMNLEDKETFVNIENKRKLQKIYMSKKLYSDYINLQIKSPEINKGKLKTICKF